MLKHPRAIALQEKVSLILLLVIAAFCVLSYTILRAVIAPAFDDLELDAARTDIIRVERAIRTDVDNLEAITADWAPWDDMYSFATGQNPGFRRSNLDRGTLTNLDLDLLAIYSTDRTLLWGRLLHEGEERQLPDLNILEAGTASAQLLTRHSRLDGRTVGLVQTGLGPMLISSRPILRNDDTGPIAGAVVMGQFLDAAAIERLRERTEVDMSWQLAAAEGAGSDEQMTALEDGEILVAAGPSRVSSRMLLFDIHGEPLLVLRADTVRSISALGGQTIDAALLFLAIGGVVVAVLIWFLLSGMVLEPIRQLTAHVDKIRKSGDLKQKLDLKLRDEIGTLAGQFDNLTEEVYEARRALLDQSFKAGKADTAAEVLHNIRNAMTPMINGLDRLHKGLNLSKKLKVAEALEQLGDPEGDAARREKLLQYIETSFRHLAESAQESAEDLRVVTSQARQVEAILADQERIANVAPIAENIVVDEVLGEAVHVLPKHAKPAVDVDMDKELGRYRVKAYRIGLLQVMGNLILNAYESIQRAGRPRGEIEVTATSEEVDDRRMVRLTVRDNGTGFDDNIGKRIFQRGFTSKSDGSTGGLGLHWCANAVRGMGGSIQAESRGMGQGAEFHVLLPAAQGGWQ